MTETTSDPSSPRIAQLLGLAGVGVVFLIVLFGLGTLLGVDGAGRAVLMTAIGAAALLGIRELLLEDGPARTVAGVLLVASGTAGIASAALGNNPFDQWFILGPMAAGVAITFFVDS